MIPRTIPKKTFIGESVNEASFIASKGIDETKAPTQRDTVGNLKNLEVNFDGSVSPRCPLMAYINLSQEYAYIDQIFTGDYICLKNTSSPYKICIVGKGTNTVLLEVSENILNTDIKVINTPSSTIVQNCDLGSELATFKIYITGESIWKSEKMIIDINTVSGDAINKVNPNLMASNPYSFRDAYNSYIVGALGILPYIKGTFDENNKEFTIDTSPATDITIKELTESGNYRIVESLPKLGSSFNFSTIYLKCFLNLSIKQSANATYYISWQRTVDGIAWEPASAQYELPEGENAPTGYEIINVPVGYIDGTKDITDASLGTSPYLFKKFNVNARENDTISNRPDVLLISNASDLEYKYRCLLYVLVTDTTIHTGIHVNEININNVDGISNASNGYYIPTFDISRTTRTFSVTLHLQEPLNTNEIEFATAHFACILYTKHTYSDWETFSVGGISPNWTISANNDKDEITITGSIDISNNGYSYNNWSIKQIGLHYVSKLAIYYNNISVSEVEFKEIIPLKDMNNVPQIPSDSSLPITLDLGELTFDHLSNDYAYMNGSNNPYNYLKCTASEYLNKLYKLASRVSVTARLTSRSFINSYSFYDITGASGFIKITSRTRNGSTSTELESTSGSLNSSNLSKFCSFWSGSAINIGGSSSIASYEVQTTAGTFTFRTTYEFREAVLNPSSSFSISCTIKPLYANTTSFILGSTSLTTDSVFPRSFPIPTIGGSRNFTGEITVSPKCVWFTGTSNGNIDALFDYTSIQNITYYIKNSEDYNNYTQDNATYSAKPTYSEEVTPVEGINAVSLNGIGTTYQFLRNYSDKVSVFYLDLGTNNANKGYKLYWNHRIVSYGAFNNNIVISDSDSLVTPLLNTLTLNASQDTEITTVVPWRNYLVAATKEAVYLIYEIDGGFGHKAVNTFIGIPTQDRRTCKAILNGIIFKSNNKVYTLQPGLYSNDDSVLNIAEISQPIESLLSSIKLPDGITYDREDINFAISTSKYYYLFIPGYPDGTTTCFKYDYVRRIWTTLEFPIIVKDYIQTTEDELYLITEDNAILHFEKDFTFFVKDIKDSDNDEVPDTDAIYGDYLQGVNSPPTPISFVLDSGQKTDNISTTKQFVETKLLAATMDNMDSFPLDVDIYIDGIQYKKIHTDINTDGAVLKKTTEDGLILGTNTTTDDIDLINTFRQLILRYSGKGKSIRHIISGSTLYNFKIYVTYYRYKLTHNKQ